MKNTMKVLGIIAFVAIIGFSAAGCKTDDDGGGGTEIKVPGNTVKEKLTWLKTSANIADKAGYTFIIEMKENETIPAGNDLTYPGSAEGITIIFRNTDTRASVLTAQTATAPLITLIANVTMILEDGIVFSGVAGTTGTTVPHPLVSVESSSTLEMKAGSAIRNNRWGTVSGGGVAVNGKFNMNGGTISNNRAGRGGGVFVGNTGIFTMTDGEIFGCSTESAGTIVAHGGGVYVETGGILRIVKGIIYGSDATDASKRNIIPTGGVPTGAALYLDTTGAGGKAERGTLSGDTWTKSGDLATTSDSISVANGQTL